MGSVVVAALGLVESLLGGRLLAIGHDTASNAVGGVGDGLLNLVLGRLGGIGGKLLLSLCEMYSLVTDAKIALIRTTYWWRNPCDRCQTC